MTRHGRLPRLGVVAIVLGALAAYLPYADVWFLKDDLALGLLADGGNPITWKGTVSFDAFVRHILWPTGQTHDQFWRPLPVFLAWIDLLVAGPDPAYFRIANIGLHAVNGVLLAALVHRLLRGRHPIGACLIGLLWTMNPIHGEAVLWITQRMVVLSATGTLVCLLAFDAWLESRRGAHMALAVVGAVVALGSKETAAAIPLMTAALEVAGAAPGTSKVAAFVRGALRFAAVPVAMLGLRKYLFGTFSGTYGKLSPAEYMSEFRVLDRLDDSLRYGLVGANESEVPTWLVGTAAAAVVAVVVLVVAACVRRGDAPGAVARPVWVGLAVFVGSFAPTLPIFWISAELTNARFLYQPLCGLMIVAACAFASPLARVATPLLVAVLGIDAATGAFNRRAYRGADAQERAIVAGVARISEDDGRRPIVVAWGVPTEHRGVATLDRSLALAVKPPFLSTAIPTIPLIEGQDGSWPAQLEASIAELRVGHPDSPLLHAVIQRDPWTVVPLYGGAEPREGKAPDPIAPEDGAPLRSPGPAPTFAFTSVPKATTYVVHLEVPGKSASYVLQPGVHAKRFGTSFRWTFADGDVGSLPDLWDLLGKGTFASPLVVSWRVEAKNADGMRLGMSAARRLVIVQASG